MWRRPEPGRCPVRRLVGMHALTENDLRAAFVNASTDDLRLLALPHDFPILDWDHLDFLAWRDPENRDRGYLVAERDGSPHGVVLRAASSSSRGHVGLCNLCHTMQPGNQVTLFSARLPDASGSSVGTYICADLSCHENVRLAAPLAPGERRRAHRRHEGAGGVVRRPRRRARLTRPACGGALRSALTEWARLRRSIHGR
jgi:hypothetical protein